MFYSHPEKYLIKHLEQVDNYMKVMLKENYGEESRIISCCHDFGKYTTYFQKYLFSKEHKETALSNHGFISALFGAFIALKKFGEESTLPLIIYNTILHHHGSLKNPSVDLPKGMRGFKSTDSQILRDKIKDAYKQIEDIKNNRALIYKDYESLGFGEDFNNFLDINIEDMLCTLRRIDYGFYRNNVSSAVYFKHQLQYSALIAGDKLSASNTKEPELKFIPYEVLDRGRIKNIETNGKTLDAEEKPHNINDGESLNSKDINNVRTEIFNEIQESLCKNYKEHKIFSITAPTGTGKTYSGFFTALKLRELLGDNRKIIYALPFTSIINQNYDVIYNLFKDVKDFEKFSSQCIIKHHSMADVDYESEHEDYNVMQAQILLENWTSSIIITTFVQLLQTLIGNKNRMLKKFNSIKNSIILLDEVQAIDIKYYGLVDYILKEAASYLDCRIIMMTATKPLILQEAHELLENYEKYFGMFSRTKLISKIKPITLEEFAEEFICNLEDKSYLIICNTISQSLKIYNSLKNIGREVYYLSTNLIPLHRKQRIEFVGKKLKNKEKPILVSTQVVEAGVDFDFDVVIRDIGPIASIIQGGGRCNRNGNGEKGEVMVYSMVDAKGKYYGAYVYGNSNIAITKELLQGKESIEEKDYLKLIEDYFREVNANMNLDASKKFINSIEKLLFNKADQDGNEEYTLDKFSLIEDNSNYIDVFMRVDEKAEDVYEKLLNAFSEKDMEIKNEKFLKIKNKVRDYTISIPMKFKDKFNIDKNTVVINLPLEGCELYYNEQVGFRRDAEEENYFMF